MSFVIALLLLVWLVGICGKEEREKNNRINSYIDEHPPVHHTEELFLEWYFYLRYRATDVEDAYRAAIERTERNMLKQGFRPSICTYGTGEVWEMSKIKLAACNNDGIPKPLKALRIDPVYSTSKEKNENDCRKGIVEWRLRSLPDMKHIESCLWRDKMDAHFSAEEYKSYEKDVLRRFRDFRKVVEAFGITDDELSREKSNYDRENQKTTKVTDINAAYAKWLKEQDELDPDYEATEFVYFAEDDVGRLGDRPYARGRAFREDNY